MTRTMLADRLRLAEESYRRAQRGNDFVRYRAALLALREVEALVVAYLCETTGR